MGEAETIARTHTPGTRQSLAEDLRRLGLDAGMAVLVHSALSALGWVCGGPVAVVEALMDVLTPAGTLVMPTHSTDLTDPAGWSNPPVPAAWVPLIRESMPAYEPRTTPTRGMGRIVETFRTWPGVRRSAHPHVSFAAWGRHAATVTAGHVLADGLGEGSPLARLYELEARVLLLGVGYDNNTSFHLAEYRAGGRPRCSQGGPILVAGRRLWVTYDDIELDDGPFAAIGAAFEREGAVRVGAAGAGTARLFSQPAAVDYATAWLRRARGAS